MVEAIVTMTETADSMMRGRAMARLPQGADVEGAAEGVCMFLHVCVCVCTSCLVCVPYVWCVCVPAAMLRELWCTSHRGQQG